MRLIGLDTVVGNGGFRTLIGASSSDVKAAQAALTKAGFDTKGVDGKEGPNTDAAITSFWASKGQSHAATVDADLLKALGVGSGGSSSSSGGGGGGSASTALAPSSGAPAAGGGDDEEAEKKKRTMFMIVGGGIAVSLGLALFVFGRSPSGQRAISSAVDSVKAVVS